MPSHPGPGAGGAGGHAGVGRVYTSGRAGVCRGLSGAGGSAQGLRESCRAGGIGPVEANDGVQAAL